VLQCPQGAADLLRSLCEGRIQLGIDHVRVRARDRLREHGGAGGRDGCRVESLVPSKSSTGVSVLSAADDGWIVGAGRIVDPCDECVVVVLGEDEEGRSLLTPSARVQRVAGRNGLLPVAFSVLALVSLVSLVALLSVRAILPTTNDGR